MTVTPRWNELMLVENKIRSVASDLLRLCSINHRQIDESLRKSIEQSYRDRIWQQFVVIPTHWQENIHIFKIKLLRSLHLLEFDINLRKSVFQSYRDRLWQQFVVIPTHWQENCHISKKKTFEFFECVPNSRNREPASSFFLIHLPCCQVPHRLINAKLSRTPWAGTVPPPGCVQAVRQAADINCSCGGEERSLN